MKIEEVYLKFLQKVNRNLTNDNISVDRGRFIFLINEEMIRRCEYLLEKKNEDDIRYLQKLLVHNKKLVKSTKTVNTRSYSLPSDFLDFINTRVYADNSECGNQEMQVWEAKGEDTDELLSDESNKPSFKYRETFYTIGGDKIHYYIDDFDIVSAYISYYRFPQKLDISGYTRADGTTSISIDPEMDDRFMDRVITGAASSYAANQENFNKHKVNESRALNKI